MTSIPIQRQTLPGAIFRLHPKDTPHGNKNFAVYGFYPPFEGLQLVVYNPMCSLYQLKSPGQLVSQAVTRAKVVQVGILGEEPLF